jgi:SAM-dependent methyltransferase
MMTSGFNYDAAAAERYDAAVPVSEEEIAFYVGYAREAEGAATLELACGTGRVMIPMARAGITMVGLDSSEAMLALARRSSASLDNVTWLEGDMTSFELEARFGLITIPAGSFHLLLTTEDQLECLQKAREHLADSGRLVIALDNPDIVRLGEVLSTKAGVLQRRKDREFVHPTTGLYERPWVTQEYRSSTQQLRSISRVDSVDQSGKVVETRYSTMTLRMVFRYEMEHLLARCGLEPEALYGDFERGEYRGSSDQMLWVARKSDG